MKKVLGILLGLLLASNAYSQVTGSVIRVMNWGTYSNWLASMTETNVVIYPTSIITNLNVIVTTNLNTIVVTNLTINITTNYSFYSSTNEQSYTIITNSPWLTNVTSAAIAAAGGLTNVSINGTLFNVVGGVATGSVAAGSGGGYTNYVPDYKLWSAPTVTITRAMGELVKLTCTSAVALLTIDQSGWDTNGAQRINLNLYGNNYSVGFDASVMTNSTLLDVSTNANRCTTLFFYRPAGETVTRVRQ